MVRHSSSTQREEGKKGGIKLKEEVKKVFLKGFTSKNIQHPLFDASRTEAKRLMITKRGLEENKRYDRRLHRLTSRYVDENRLTSKEFEKQIDRWVGQLKVRAGDTKTSYRQPGRVIHSLTKVGSVGRPLEIIHMDLADVNRLNPDRQRYRYPFILVAVDAFSNYTVLVPVKDKSAESVLNAIKNSFNQFGISKKDSTSSYLQDQYRRKSKRSVMDDEDEERAKRWCMVTNKLQTDRGSEFVNDTLRKFLKRRRVELFSSRGSGKAYLSESKIGQMKHQLVRIQDILECEVGSKIKKKRKKKKQSAKKKNTKNTKKRIQYDSEGEEIDDDDQFDDYTVYQSDWSKYLKDLQIKINNKRNLRTGYTPAQLFKRFTGGSKQDWEKRYRVNETKTQFEPLDDTMVKIRLLKKSNSNSKQQKQLLARVKSRTKAANKQHAWKSGLQEGDRVFLTHSRLKGYPSEKPLKIFEKKSMQTKSEWDTSRLYEIDTVYNATKSKSPKRYRLRNVKSGMLRKTLYYREELLAVAKSTTKKKKKHHRNRHH